MRVLSCLEGADHMIFKKYYDYVTENRNVKYDVCFKSLPFIPSLHKWVGAQYRDSCVYGIPNDMNAFLKYLNDEISFLGTLEEGKFKWTGGCIWDDCLYGFARNSNSLIKMSLYSEKIEMIPLEKGYSKEHHYGGICTKNGIIYQPPRDSNHILVWNLITKKTKRICLNTEKDNQEFRYCGSILHPNGYAYFLPEIGERVIKLNTRTEEWSFIGDRIDAMVFDVKIAADGNIYGYSAYCKGILKIHVKTDSVEMIHEEIYAGAYGTKLGVNGHLYSIPGDGDMVWDYNPLTDSLDSIYQFSYVLDAKYAGGTSMMNGDILAVPAKDNQLFQLRPDMTGLQIPDDIFQEYFQDCY